MSNFIISTDGTRAVQPAIFGIACYSGNYQEAQWHGRHVGICKDEIEAQLFLQQGITEHLVRVH